MWNGLYTAEKIVIQWTLLSEACYFAVQFLGNSTFQYIISFSQSFANVCVDTALLCSVCGITALHYIAGEVHMFSSLS